MLGPRHDGGHRGQVSTKLETSNNSRYSRYVLLVFLVSLLGMYEIVMDRYQDVQGVQCPNIPTGKI